MQRDPECIFCRIVAGEVPSDIVFQDEHVLAFRDIQPAAPTHVLIVPRVHIADLTGLASQPADLAAALLRASVEIARQLGLDERGFRLISNVGAWGGQTIYHLHFHLLGGRQLGALG
jgi:histidine triad (HIT) family protein